MRDARTENRTEASDLEMLERVGFGLDSVLMNDPKILVDGRFLAALLLEFEAELGRADAAEVLFQIGLIHGFRDAERSLTEPSRSASAAGMVGPMHAATPIAMELQPIGGSEQGVSLRGRWPEIFEAEARLARCGRGGSPCCALSAGYTSGWLSGAYEADVLVVERACASAGDTACAFDAREIAAWRGTAEAGVAGRRDAGLFARCREAARGQVAGVDRSDPDAAEARDLGPGRLDGADDAVHIWGPVMVLPFTNIDEALSTVEMLTRDPATNSVRAVVIDLRQAPLDDGFIAAGLERIIETLSGWDAEVILTGVSSIAEAIVAELETAHLLTRKELPDAIAAAFQIAEAQRHVL